MLKIFLEQTHSRFLQCFLSLNQYQYLMSFPVSNSSHKFKVFGSWTIQDEDRQVFGPPGIYFTHHKDQETSPAKMLQISSG